MKKLGYLLSIAGHALALLIVMSARFAITIRPDPPRVVVVSIAEPTLHFQAARAERPRRTGRAGATAPASGGSMANGGAGNGKIAGTAPHSGRHFPAAGAFSLQSRPSGTFRLAAVGKTPDPWAVPVGPTPSSRLQGYRPETFRATSGGGNAGSGVFLVPFDIREKAVAAWTETALSRIERNWFIPSSARLSFSGRVQVTLIIEKNGSQRALAVDDPALPEALSRSALHAVQASLPLPPLPENVAGETFAFTFVFIYNG